ncbi:MAG TPA: hypothetical protein VGB49_06935 [Caulobacteraceae bacterium]|jgi:hypothetical protein
MPFDAADFDPHAAAALPRGMVAGLIDGAQDPDVALAAGNPDRLLAFLYVAPRECEAVDALLAA